MAYLIIQIILSTQLLIQLLDAILFFSSPTKHGSIWILSFDILKPLGRSVTGDFNEQFMIETVTMIIQHSKIILKLLLIHNLGKILYSNNYAKMCNNKLY